MKNFKIMDLIKFDLPMYWASALINDDYSGLDAAEENAMNQWYIDNTAGLACIDVSEESYVGIFAGLITDMATYTFTKLH